MRSRSCAAFSNSNFLAASRICSFELLKISASLVFGFDVRGGRDRVRQRPAGSVT